MGNHVWHTDRNRGSSKKRISQRRFSDATKKSRRHVMKASHVKIGRHTEEVAKSRVYNTDTVIHRITPDEVDIRGIIAKRASVARKNTDFSVPFVERLAKVAK